MKALSLNQPDAHFTLKSERLTIRPVVLSDVKALWPYTSDPTLSETMSWHPHKDISETEAFVVRAIERFKERRAFNWCLWQGEKLCGLFSLLDIKTSHYALTFNSAELGYWCAPPFRGQGLMTEAGKTLIWFAFDLGFHRLRVEHRADNEASKRMIERLGFKFIGVQRQHLMKNGKWYDQYAYDLLATDLVRGAL